MTAPEPPEPAQIAETVRCGRCGEPALGGAYVIDGVPYCHVDRGLGPYQQTCYEIESYRELAARNDGSQVSQNLTNESRSDG